MRLRAVPILFVLLGCVLGCARIVAPSGGPADEEPARVTAMDPADGALETGPRDAVAISFSERVERNSVLDHLFTDPPNLIRRVSWPEDTLLVVEFWQKFRPDTTVAVYLTPGWTDYHYVAQPDWQVSHFATGDSLLPGWLGGACTFKSNASRRMFLRLSDAAGDVDREARPDGRGEFIFRQLPADGRAWRLWAFEDVDEDSLFDPAVDFADTLADSVVVITAAAPLKLDLRLNVIDPDEPGEVSGKFACGDTLPGAFLVRALRDSLRLPGDSLPDADPALLPDSLLARLRGPAEAEFVWLREAGPFTLDNVAPGPLFLFVHKDIVADSLWDPLAEPAWLDPGPRVLAPGGALNWPSFRFPSDSTEARREASPRPPADGRPGGDPGRRGDGGGPER